MLSFYGGRDELRSRLCSAASIIVDRRQPLDMIRDSLDERAVRMPRAAEALAWSDMCSDWAFTPSAMTVVQARYAIDFWSASGAGLQPDHPKVLTSAVRQDPVTIAPR